MLYLFAGTGREASVANLIRHIAKEEKVPATDLCILEYDILRSRRHDLSLKQRQLACLTDSNGGVWDVVLRFPPCNTRGRACWGNRLGPGPRRSFEHPTGFPRLAPA